MRPNLEEFACDTVAEEIATRQRNSIVSGIAVVTPEFIEKWSLDEEVNFSPFLTRILTMAAQTDRAKIHNKMKKPEKMVQVITRQLLYQFSNNCLTFQAVFGLFLWSTGCARQTIDTLFRCGLSVAYDLVLNLVKSLGNHCDANTVRIVATEPTGLGYDNINISTSIFVEQRGSSSPAKVTSGTFTVFYGLRNAKWEHMLIAPIRAFARFRASTGLQFNRDIRPNLDHLRTFHNQLVVHIIQHLLAYNEGFENVAKHPSLRNKSICAIPVGWKTPQIPTQASTIEEVTTRGNLLFHDELYIDRLKRTPELMSKYAIPIFQLGFGLFHLCLNLPDLFFFALLEKTWLGNDQPDYHSLLAARTQVLDGMLLNAWRRECGFSSFKLFAESNPSPQTLRDIASSILKNYSTPMIAPGPKSPAKALPGPG
ncbi:hypothetical protein K438DRAFT_1910249 [Mycena galopus ATCC 62051]|nr:hypothetical protein K438DRAFT_1910249 [Mycena galopus ATCC 62051]